MEVQAEDLQNETKTPVTHTYYHRKQPTKKKVKVLTQTLGATEVNTIKLVTIHSKPHAHLMSHKRTSSKVFGNKA